MIRLVSVASFEPFGAVIPTPEPSSLLLLAAGLLSALGGREGSD